MKFEKYHFEPQIHANLEALGFKRPTDIQFKAIPPILKGEDVLAIAQTGTGKTAAFAIPIIQKLYSNNNIQSSKHIKCLVMEPTHELALQISEVFEKICANTHLQVGCIVGGVEQEPQIAKLKQGIDILVATPGRMFDLVNQKHIDLSNVEILVLDEADHMLDLGFLQDINDTIRRIPQKHQTLFFSATISLQIKNLAYSLVESHAIRIQISPKDPVSKNIDHTVAFVEMDDKRFFLERIIKQHPESKILVFVRTKVRAERVMEAMKRVDIASMTIHSSKDQKDRMMAMNSFKDGSNKVLIATDVSARGVDIPNVEYVVNYDLPEEVENYVHRVGRTGRGDKKGFAVSFCSTEEKELLTEIEEFLTNKIRVIPFNRNEYEETIDMSAEVKNDWRTLIKEANLLEEKMKKKTKSKKK